MYGFNICIRHFGSEFLDVNIQKSNSNLYLFCLNFNLFIVVECTSPVSQRNESIIDHN